MRLLSVVDIRFKFSFLFAFCFCAGLHAQDPQIDSLKQALKGSPNDTTRIKLLTQLTEIGNIEEIPLYADSAVKLCEKAIAENRSPRSFYIYNLANAINNIGFYQSRHGNPQKALEYYQKALKLYEEQKDRKMTAILLNNIAFIYDNQGYVSRALEYFYKNLKVQEEIGDTVGAAYSLNNIGYVYISLRDYSKALECFTQSLKMYRSINDKKGTSLALHNTGLVYFYRKEYPTALDYYTKSLAISEEGNNYYTMASTRNNIGGTYFKLGDYPKALEYYDKSLALSEKYQYKDLISVTLVSTADVWLEAGNVSKAESYAVRGLAMTKEMGSPRDIRNASGTMKRIYLRQKKYKEAYVMFEQEQIMRDSIINEENKKESVKQELQYEYEKKDLQARLTEEKRLSALKLENERKLTRKNILMYLLISLAVILCLSIFYLYKFFKQKSIINANKNNELRQKLLLSQMNPHFIFNSVDNIQSLIHNKQDKEAINYLTKFSKLTRQILENSNENYITLQEELHMTENYLMIQQLLYNNSFTYTIEVEEQIDTEAVLLPPMLTQPFIENAIKHGLKNKTEGGIIRVRFYMKDKALFFEVRDNGSGLQAKVEGNEHRSLATQIVNERLNNNAAKKTIVIRTENILENNIVKGVSTTFEIPYIYNN